ncbi:MAG: hypothetical protein ACOCRD_01220 [Halorubrum sp.]
MNDRGDSTGGSDDPSGRGTDDVPPDSAIDHPPHSETRRVGDRRSESTERRGDIDPAVAATAREELRTTFDYQVERLREIDNKAIEILKANLLLIGIVVTGGSIIVQTTLDLAVFLNPFTVGGGLLLLASTGLAAVTYTASDLRGGLDIRAVDAVIDADRGTEEGETAAGDAEFDERLLRSYAEWIDYNARVTAVNDLLATVTVLLIFVAFVYVIAGVVVGAANLAPLESWISFVVLTLASAAFTWIAAHMDHLGPESTHPAASFAGIPLSKGGDRRQAWSSLRAMLGRAPTEAEAPGVEAFETDLEREGGPEPEVSDRDK